MDNKFNEYDDMKEMMNITRGLRKLVKEENQGVRTLSEPEMQDEIQRFQDAVTNNVNFGNFNRYDDNIEWSGVLLREKISFVFSLDDTVGCYISCDQLQLTEEIVKTMQALHVYYGTWADYWGSEMNN